MYVMFFVALKLCIKCLQRLVPKSILFKVLCNIVALAARQHALIEVWYVSIDSMDCYAALVLLPVHHKHHRA